MLKKYNSGGCMKSFIMVLFILTTVIFLRAEFPGYCLEFDGTNDYARGYNLPTSFSAITLETWVKHTGLGATNQRYITISSESAVLRFNGGTQLHFYVKQSNATLADVVVDDLISIGEWTHVAGTYDGTTLKLYVNGREAASAVAPVGGFGSNDGAFDLSSDSETMYGFLDDIRVWNLVRSETQIRLNMHNELTGSESGLIAYWKLDEGSGGTVYDTAGSSDGTLYNMTASDWQVSDVPFIRSENAYALDFDGLDDYLNCGSEIQVTGSSARTIEAWAKVEAFNEGGIFMAGETGTDLHDFSLRTLTTDNDWRIQVWGTEDIDVTLAGSKDNWHHYCVTYDGTTVKLYYDGQLAASEAMTLNTESHDIWLGKWEDNEFDGQIDEVRVWNVARTQTQIQDNMYSALNGDESGLVAYYQFDAGSGDIAYDVASGYNADLINMSSASWVTGPGIFGEGVSGSISSNTTWSSENIIVTGDITINNGVTLNIDPGVNVLFLGPYSISVEGTIIADGTASEQILFSSGYDGEWSGIKFDDTDNSNITSEFDYCIFEDGSSGAGGAIYVYIYDGVSINNSIFRDNYGYQGGAIYVDWGDISVQNSEFYNNSANDGGAIYCTAFSEATFSNIYVHDNSASNFGGGFTSTSASPTLDKCIFDNNNATDSGGGLFFSSESPVLKQCLIINNSAVDGGGICLSGVYADIYNCTIADNSADNGGGAWIGGIGCSLNNTIISSNTATNGNEIYLQSTSADPDFYYCNVLNGTSGFAGPGAGSSFNGDYVYCIASDPLFTGTDDYTLTALSSCLNGGDPAATTGQVGTTDLAGNNRFFNSNIGQNELNTALDRIDIGVYEYNSESGVVPDDLILSSDQNLNASLNVPEAVTFDIAAGTELSFGSNYGINIYGNISAVGTDTDLIVFTASNTASGWTGLNFLGNGSAKNSRLEYCQIEYGNAVVGRNEAAGGNIYLEDYDGLLIRNCFIQLGTADNGGALYCIDSELQLVGCVVNDNMSTSSGGAVYSEQSDIDLINLTVVNNDASGDGPALFFSEPISPQPVIKNCIIRENGASPIYPDDSSLTEIDYCNIDHFYPGSNNINVDPIFTGAVDHPYDLGIYSYCMNMGYPDTTGLQLPALDIKGQPRIFEHSEPSYNRIDLGAYEYQGLPSPFNFSASDGDNNYPGYVQLFWEYNTDYAPVPEGFRIFRNDISINVIDGQTYSYSDYSAVPGQVYSYYIQAFSGSDTGDSAEDSGYLKPNGIISGTVLSANNNPVQGVKVSLNPSPGYCLELDSASNSSLTISDPGVNMDFNFSLELWVRTAQNDVELIRRGSHSLSIDASDLLNYTDGINTLVQEPARTLSNDNDWHHIAVVNDYTEARVEMYLDGSLVAADTTFTFANNAASDLIVDELTGYLDDIRVWSAARDSSQIQSGMNIITSWDATGLLGYWTCNEGTGNVVFDATNYANNGTLSNCSWSVNDPDILLGAYTDAWGEYIISQIYYGTSTTFSVTPSKPGHIFQPEQRNVTLSESNIAQNGVDFTDNSLIPISGVVEFQGTECPVVGATILLNGAPSVPVCTTDEEGSYILEVEHGDECTISVDYNDHIFNREWQLGVVTFPVTDVDFEDTFKTQFKVEVVGGEDKYPIGDFDVTLQSLNGCYYQEITDGNWALGSIMIQNIPPLEYNVTVDPGEEDPFGLTIDEQFQNMKTQTISMTNPDSTLDTLSFVWQAPLQIEVTWPDTLELQHFPEYPESEFYVLNQNIWYDLKVEAFEDYSFAGHPNQFTFLDDCDIQINDEVGTKGETISVFQDTTVFTYSFAPYLPSILSGYNRQYQKMLEITVFDAALNRFATQTDWVLIQGVKPLESTYATTSPEIPFLVIHDPPGDASFSSFNESSSRTMGFSTSVCTDDEHNIFETIHLGPDITVEAGSPFFSVETEIDIIADFEMGITMETEQNESMEQEITFTTSTEYTTSEEDQVIGDGADVFVGGAINLIWGITNEIDWDELAQTVIVDTSIMVTPNGFATIYVYTDNQIRNTVIPNLYMISDSTSAELWQSFLDMNETNKQNAQPNPNHPDNISFNAGAGYSYEEENSSSTTQTIEFESTVSTEFGALAGLVVDGVGGEFGYSFRTAITTGRSSSESFETTTTTSFTLADDDETSELNELADYFTLDIKVDPQYGTPVFSLLSGASSCPWEAETQPRDGVSFSANTYTATGLLEGEEAAFLLYLGNNSQSFEDRRYYLTVQHGSNPGGANVKINGVPLEERMAFDIPSGEVVQAVMTVGQGPYEFEYEDLTLEFYSECDRDNDGPDGHYFDIYREFNIYWEPPYSRVSIDYPEADWIINQANNDTLEVLLTDYDLSKPDFESLKLEYKNPSDTDWLPAFQIFKDSLLNDPNYRIEPWNVSLIPDGSYEIRAAATDSVHATYYTNALRGTIDREPPEVLDLPEPADGILDIGEVIALSFTEHIDPNAIYPGDISLIITETGDPVDIDIDVYENRISLIPNIANYWLENKTLAAQVTGIYDLFGNLLEETVSWEFYVNANPVYWNVTKLEVIKPLGEELELTASLINSGGQYSSFNIEDVPEWLSVYPMTGSLLPLDSQTVELTVTDQIGFGTYLDTIYADITGLGREALVLEVSVLSNPPYWALGSLGNYDYSMTITGELEVDGEISDDLNDVIGAFVELPDGELECRGFASIDQVPFFADVYQFFLTVHSDVEYGEELLFRIWDASTSREYFGVDESYTFLDGAVYGTSVSPEVLHVTGNLIQSIICEPGWNWISTNVQNLTGMAVDSVLSSLSPQLEDLIKGQTDYAQYTPGTGWLGTLDSLTTTDMYKLKLSSGDRLEVIGNLEDPYFVPITYGSGWNWIGFIPHVSVSVNDALTDITNLETGDLIKSQNKYSQYIAGYGWYGSLLFMNPGEGYMLKTVNSGSFNYPEYIPDIIRLTPVPENPLLTVSREIGWEVNPLAYEYSSNLTTVIFEGGIPQNSPNVLLGAFQGEECRGVAAPQEVLEQNMFFLTTYSNEIAEEISYKIYLSETEEVFELLETTEFVNNQILGNPLEPFELNYINDFIPAPDEFQFEIIDNIFYLQWEAIPGAVSYQIYSSSDPNLPFEQWTLEESNVRSTSWSEPVTDIKKFYRVISSTE